MQHVVVVGGGITGLATAYYLQRVGVAVSLFEASGRLGGNIRTERHDGFTIEAGPDGWVTQKPHVATLVKALGRGDRLISPTTAAKRVYVVKDRRLQAMPDGMSLGVPTTLSALWQSDLFSVLGKVRMMSEGLLPPKDDAADESVGAFLRRRLGNEATDVVAGPLLGGIFSGDVDEMSLAATFPQLREGERRFGSLTRAMMARAKDGTSTFTGMRSGMGELIDLLHEALADGTVFLNEPVVGVIRRSGGYDVVLESGRVEASHVVFAGRTQVPARLLAPLSPRLGRVLSSFEYESTAMVFFALDEDGCECALDGSGFIVPRKEAQTVRACTWLSTKWPNRAPANKALLRAFVSGPEVKTASSDELIDRCASDLTDLMGLRRGKIRFTRVYRLLDASPKPRLGHLERVEGARVIAREDLPNVVLIGQPYDGAGIPDCIRQAVRTANEISAS